MAVVTMLGVSSLQAQGWRHQWQVTDHPTLQLSVDGVDVLVEAGPRNSIEAVLEADGWSLGKSPGKIDQHQEGNAVTLRIQARPFVGVRYMRLRLKIPSSVDANLRSNSGAVVVHDLHGRLRVDATSGAIQVEGVDGAMEASTDTGSIHIHGRFDTLRLRSGTGAIEAEIAPGSRLTSDWRIESDTGSNLIKVSPSLQAEIEARTGSGKIHSELQIAADGFQSRSEVRGKLNGGGPALMVSSRTGSIRLANL